MNLTKIDINHLDFEYSSDTKVLHDIDLHFDGSGLLCIVGPNGVGKSTLVRCLNKLLKPTSGSIVVNGTDISEMTAKQLSEMMSFVPATTTIAFPMSVVDSVLIAMDKKDKWHRTDEDVGKVYLALSVLRIKDLALRNCDELSAGQIQKVALCRGLIRNSEIMILDEPTANLDIKHQIFVSDFMHELSEAARCTIIMISHDLNIAARYADKIIVLSKPGKVYSVGTPEEVITEQMIRDVYDVDSEVIHKNGRPYVFLNSALNW